MKSSVKSIHKDNKNPRSARPTQERGAITVEFAIVFPVVLAVFLGFWGLDSYIQTQRALEWAVGEVMLCNRLSQDITDITSEPKQFSFAITDDKEPTSTCELLASGERSRCQAAHQNTLLIHRAVSSFLGVGALQSITVTSEFQDIIVEGNGSPRLRNNRLLTLRVVGNNPKQLFQSWVPAKVIERTEAIG
jgi:hypothetical protein